MKITMMLESDNPDEIARFTAALNSMHPDNTMKTPRPPEAVSEAVREAVREVVQEDAQGAPEATDAAPEPEVELSVLDTARQDMKETRTATLGDGSTASADDEVMLSATGEVAVVLATFRGKLVVADEAGDQTLVDAKEVAAASQEDAPSADEPAAEPADAPADASEITPEQLRAKMQEAMQKAGSTEVRSVLLDHGAVNVSSIPDDKRGAVYTALEALCG